MVITEAFAKVIVDLAAIAHSEGQEADDDESQAILMTWIRSKYPQLAKQYSYLPWEHWANQEGE